MNFDSIFSNSEYSDSISLRSSVISGSGTESRAGIGFGSGTALAMEDWDFSPRMSLSRALVSVT